MSPIPIPSQVTAVMKRWQESLLDLTRRNRLLHYKPNRSTSVRLVHPDLYDVVDELDADGGGWHVFIPEEEEEETDSTQLPVEPGRKNAKPCPGDSIQFEKGASKSVAKCLVALERSASIGLAERGVHTLHLAVGLLEWQDPNSHDDLVRSPLLLFPVRLSRPSIFDRWRIEPSDEEILLNPTLSFKLQADFNFSLPALPPPETEDRAEGGSLARNYFETLRSVLPPDKTWRVLEEAWLDVFSFQKLVLWKDLEENRARAGVHPVIKALAGEPDANGIGPTDVPLAKDLDRLLAPKDSFIVLDADSSQLAAVESVRKGTSLVLQGPPGTGKSQTISNMIAQALADKKKVLFVSEKMAALEVVKRRLEKTQLDGLCLELHSNKANRREVVAALSSSLCQALSPDPKGLMSHEELSRLEKRRAELNEYVEELHKVRQPFGRSVRQVIGELAKLSDSRLQPMQADDKIASLRSEQWRDLLDNLARISVNFDVLKKGESYPWYGLKPVPYSGQLRAILVAELGALSQAILEIGASSRELGTNLCLPPVTNARQARGLDDIAEALSCSPGVGHRYFEGTSEIASVVAKGTELCTRREKLISGFSTYYPGVARTDCPATKNIETVLKKFRDAAMTCKLGFPLPVDTTGFRSFVNALLERLSRCLLLAKQLEGELGFRPKQLDIARLRNLRLTASEVLSNVPFQTAFFDPQKHSAAQVRLSESKSLWEQVKSARAALYEEAEATILELDLQRLIEDFRTRYSGWSRIFSFAWRRDRRAIQAKLRSPANYSRMLSILERARELSTLESALVARREEDEKLFGSLAKGVDTDTGQIAILLGRAATIIQALPDRPLPNEFLGAVTAGSFLPQEIRQLCEEFCDAYSKLLEEMEKSQKSLPETSLEEFQSNLRELLASTDVILQHITCFSAMLKANHSFEDLVEGCRTVEFISKVELEMENFGEHDAQILGGDYCGFDTDWPAISSKLTFVHRLNQAIQEPIPQVIIDLVQVPQPDLVGWGRLQESLRTFDKALSEIGKHFEGERLEIVGSKIEELSFQELLDHLRFLDGNISCIEPLMDMKLSLAAIEGLGCITANTIRRFAEAEGNATDFVSSLQRSILQKWLDIQSWNSPTLASFRGQLHENIIREFRELDLKLILAGPHRVIEQCGDRTRDGEYGEVAIIKREAAKRRRHLHIRQLMKNCPTLIPHLRPCFMMSPLSVAQFLKDSTIHFDLVVFDEASQIFVEDAIGAIMRADQVVVCGDEKQLPPSSFFLTSISSGDDPEGDLDETVQATDYESILSAATTALKQTMLRWHYRSRHESLIAFSNSRFYESKLVTFPSAIAESPHLGVKWRHLSDGVFDRGKSRTNQREAEEIVDLVIEHWRLSPEYSLGVVTLSQPQMDKVLDVLELRIRQEPELEQKYSEENEEPFFVKNLENVQGDQRDHIILGIGYGRDSTGRIIANFGPINSKGGERRLNVAVSRAKRKMTLVSSITYRDIPVSPESPDGVRNLHKFLEYAERGASVLETTGATGGGPESPFEEAVAAGIRSMGYDVVHQVGCSEFRIDLGIIDPNQPGHFLLAVECDGATYHSAATARDRDRLRQSVLEDLGWKFHRIWGPDWIKHRDRELARLREALIRAAHAPTCSVSEGVEAADSSHRTAKIVTIDRSQDSTPTDETSIPCWATPFRPATFERIGEFSRFELHTAPPGLLGSALADLATQENGISFERAARLLNEVWRGGSLTRKIRVSIESGLSHLPHTHTYVDPFILVKDAPFKVQLPNSEDDTMRAFLEVPPGEVALAIKHIITDNGIMSLDDLARATARLYGTQRVTARVRLWFDQVVQSELDANRLEMLEERVRISSFSAGRDSVQ